MLRDDSPLWQLYRFAPDHVTRSAAEAALLQFHRPWVLRIARRFHRRPCGPALDFDDSVAAGQLGLLKAIRGFDPGRGCQFSTYAYYAIMTAIRRQLLTLKILRHEGSGRAPICETDLGPEARLEIATRALPDACPAEQQELLALLRSRLGQLPARWRIPVSEAAFNSQTFGQIGSAMNLSAERARQLYHEALRELRSADGLATCVVIARRKPRRHGKLFRDISTPYACTGSIPG